MESFDVLHDPIVEELGRDIRIRQLDGGALYMTTKAGEHEMQGRFLFSMLKDKKAYDKDGKEIGSVLDYYYSEGGKLKFDKEGKVDLVKSEWEQKDRFALQYKTKGILSRLHGEYSDLGRVALQRGAGGRMAYMFRKFVFPGYKRRWAKEAYIERLEDFVEGSYRSTADFMKNLGEDFIKLKFSLLAENWDELTDHQKANVRRTITEAAFVTLAIVVARFALAKVDDIDDEGDERYWAFVAYQAARLKAELLFFISPKEAMSILRSPAASISMVENIIKLFGQMGAMRDVYERGPWKGKPKIHKTLANLTPAFRQIYRIRDMKEQTSWFAKNLQR
jgi:hypothetical protein